MIFVAGIDMGAKLTKAIVLDGERRIRGKSSIRTKPDFPVIAQDALDIALKQAGIAQSDLGYIATTGFGRYNVPFRDVQITDITCVARGSVFLFPKTRCVLDIGAQSTRALRVNEAGKVLEFRTNDKCAAGAGGFIERAAKYLEVAIEQVGDLSLNAKKPQTISSVCAVLAESEIINHVSSGETVEDILRGVHNSLASRALALLKRAGLEEELTFVGGVARQNGMVKALSETVKKKVNVSDEPEMVGAIGAALLALKRLEKIREGGKEPASAAQVA
ncbi:MAG TPA: acyl-CoA dehydratase activase [Verrucomicrobiae bacterium]|jgi:predicted CoA-substrate-specific enzyme activase|nr:acyl-CoA dehydratase activase [Verrucomicrobiae bacterium]